MYRNVNSLDEYSKGFPQDVLRGHGIQGPRLYKRKDAAERGWTMALVPKIEEAEPDWAETISGSYEPFRFDDGAGAQRGAASTASKLSLIHI